MGKDEATRWWHAVIRCYDNSEDAEERAFYILWADALWDNIHATRAS